MTVIAPQVLTVARLQKENWREVYVYKYNDRGAGFKVFASDRLPGITVTHDKKVGASRTIIYYTVNKRRTDSPSQACKIWNESKRSAEKDNLSAS